MNLVTVIALYVSDTELLPSNKLNFSKQLAVVNKVMPYRIMTASGEIIYIDRINDVIRAASLKAGRLGIRYTCTVTTGDLQKEIYLYKDEDEWFMEE